MPSDSEGASAKGEVPPVPPQANDTFSEEGEASDYDSPAAAGPRDTKSAETPTSEFPSDAPPLPDEPVPGAEPTTAGRPTSADDGAQAGDEDAPPPLPDEAPPAQAAAAVDDGWDAMWDAVAQAWYFYNRFTGLSQWENPRVPAAGGGPSSSTTAGAAAAAAGGAAASTATSQPGSVAGGYNPAIHGSWDPNASYAQAYKQVEAGGGEEGPGSQYGLEGVEDLYAQGAAFNARTGKFQTPDQTPERHSDAAKSQRQMNAYFDVDRAANSHDGRSLKAERRGKQPTKKELAAWKEKRKARKEEKRRAWLRD